MVIGNLIGTYPYINNASMLYSFADAVDQLCERIEEQLVPSKLELTRWIVPCDNPDINTCASIPTKFQHSSINSTRWVYRSKRQGCSDSEESEESTDGIEFTKIKGPTSKLTRDSNQQNSSQFISMIWHPVGNNIIEDNTLKIKQNGCTKNCNRS